MALFAVFAVPWALELFPHMTGVPALFDKESIIVFPSYYADVK